MASGIIDNGFIKFGFSDAGTLGYGSNKTPGIFYDATGKFNYPSNADFLTPGSPRESFSIKVGSTIYSNQNENFQYPQIPTTITANLIKEGAKTFGTITAVSNIGGIEITQVYSVDADDTIINMSVTMKNTTGATINNVKYSRGIDPDVDSPLGTTSTNNSQGTTGVSKNDLVLSEGPISHRIIGFYTNDSMTHNTSVTRSWSTDPDAALSGQMDGTGDNTINIGFNVGNLAAGQAKSFSFAYVFVASPADIQKVIDTVPASNPVPTFTAFDGDIVTGAEDTQVTITHADLLAHGNEADKNADDSAGSVPAFVVKAVTSGTLLIGATAETAKAWAVNSNDVIDATNKAFWTPAKDANGNLNAFTVVARDAEGSVSATPVQAVVSVTPVNDAPKFNSGAILTPVLEDAADPGGMAIASMMTPRFSDVDAGSSLGGVVVVGNTTTETQGKWTYSTDNGATWHEIGTVSAATGLVLPASAKLRFEAEANWNGTPGALSVLPVDNAYAGAYSNGATRATFDSTTDALASGVGENPVTIGTSITSVNDAPVFTSAPGAAALTETAAYDDALAEGKVELATGELTGTLSASDVDHLDHAFGIRGGTTAGGTVTKVGFYGTLTVDTATGAWQYTPNNFVAINALGEGKTASDKFDFKVSDPEGAFSLQNLTITLTGTNDLPVVTSALADQAFSGAGTWTYQLPADSFTDADGTPLTYTATLADGSALPAWLNFDEASRTFSGDPGQDSGSLSIKVTASDGTASIDDTFTLDLTDTGNEAPYLNKAPLPPVVSDVREQFSAMFGDALGGTEITFDGETVSLGDAAKPANVANAVAAGDYANWTAALKDGSSNTVVFTAKNPGAVTDVANVVNGGSYDGTATINKINEGTDDSEGVRESFVLNLADANGGNTMTFDGVTIPLSPEGSETASEVADILAAATFPNWTAVAAGSQVTFTHKSAGDQPDGDISQFTGNYFGDNPEITVSNVIDGGATTPGESEVFEVTYTGGLGGSTLVFDGETVTAGIGLTAAQVAAAVADHGATANWNVATDSATPGKVVYTANTPGNMEDVTAAAFTGNTAVVAKTGDGAGWTYTLPGDTFIDPEGSPLTHTATIGGINLDTAGTDALRFDPGSLTFSGNGSALPAGTITVTATDSANKSASASFDLTLGDGADTGVSAGAALVDVTWDGAGSHSYHLANSAFDFADGGTLTLSAKLADGKALPAWLKFDAATATFSGNPPDGSEASYAVRVTATDGTGVASNATQDFNLTVTRADDAPIVVSQLPDAVTDTSGNWSLNIGKLLFSDPDGTAEGTATSNDIAYSAQLANGEPLPSWLSFNDKAGVFSGNPPAGTPYLNVVVSGTTANGVSASTSFTLGLTTDADAAAATNSQGSLEITGTPASIGSILSAGDPVDDDGVTGTPTYQWQVSSDGGTTWSDIGGVRATGKNLSLTVAESGKSVRAVSFYNDEGGVAEAPESNVIAVPKFNVQGSVTLAGTQSPGQVLTALVSDQNGLAEAAPSYQWQVSTDGVNFTDIAGATYSAYTLGNADGGKYVRVNVTYSDDEVSAENIYSAPTKQLDLGMVAPVGVDDNAIAVEAGGVDNNVAGSDAGGNLLANDTDANSADTRTVTSVRAGAAAGLGEGAEAGADGFTITGQYGTLTVKADGTYTYLVDQTNFAVNALNVGKSLVESFNYTVTDNTELSDSAVLNITITGANDAPTVIFAPTSLTAVEDLKTGIVMPTLFNISDVDGGTAFSVQLLASAGKLSGVNGAGVTVSGNDSGVLTVTGAMSDVSAWLKTPGNAFYTGAPNVNGAEVATITLMANDGSGYKPMASPIKVDIESANDAAVIDLDANNSSGATGNDFITTFRPRGEAVAVVDTDVAITDIDAGALMAGARVAITGGAWDNDFGTTYETLSSTAGNSYMGSKGAITISGNGSTVVTLSGAGTMADYQNALKTVRYDNANPNAFAGDRTVTISVTDTSSAKVVTLATPSATVGTGMSVLLNGVDTGATVTQVIDGSHFVTSSVVAGLAISGALSFATGAVAAAAVAAGNQFSTVALNAAIAVGQKIFIDGADSGLTVSAIAGSLITASGAVTLDANAALSFQTSATAVPSGLVSNSGSFTTAANNTQIAIGQKIYVDGADSGQTVAAVVDGKHYVASGPLSTLSPTSALSFYLNGNLVTSATNAAPLAATTTIKTPWTPVVDLDGAASSGRDRATTFTEGQSGVAIATSDASITDQDGNLKSVVVTLTNPVDGAAEKLFISDGLKGNLMGLGITTSISADGHTLTFSGNRDATYYQLGLRGVQYQNASENPGVTPRVVTVAVTDQEDNAGVNAQTVINVVPVNDAPVIVTNTGAVVLEGGTVVLTTAQLASSDVDDAAATLDYVITTAPTKGVLFRDLNNNNRVDAGEALTTNAKFNQGELSAGIIKYAQTDTPGASSTPYGQDSFGFKVRDGLENGAVAPGGDFSIAITPVNDAPLLTAVASNPTFSENGADPAQGGWAKLFAGTAVNPVETAQHVIEVRFTVAGVADGSAEKIRIDGREVDLSTGSGTTSTGSFGYAVSVSNGVATVVVSKAGAANAEWASLFDGIAYRNTSNAPSGSARTITLTQVKDDGGTTNGGIDLTKLNLSSSVAIVASDSAPTLGTNAGASVANGGVVTLGAANLALADSDSSPAALKYTVTTAPVNGVLFRDLNGNGKVDASETIGKGAQFTQQDLIDGRIKFMHNGEAGSAESFKFTAGDAKTTLPEATFSFAIGAAAGTIGVDGGGDNTPSTDGRTPLFSDVNVTPKAGDTVGTLTFTIGDVKDGNNEVLKLNGLDLPLGDGHTQTSNGIEYTVSVDPSGKATVTVTDPTAPGFSAEQAEGIIAGVRYTNSAVPPTAGVRPVHLELTTIDADGDPTGTYPVDFDGSIVINPTTAPLTGADLPPPATGSTIETLTFTVGAVTDGDKEVFKINGRDLPLKDGYTATDGDIVYKVSIDADGKATITVTDSRLPGFTEEQAETIVREATYVNNAVPPTGDPRTVTLVSQTEATGATPPVKKVVEIGASGDVTPGSDNHAPDLNIGPAATVSEGGVLTLKAADLSATDSEQSSGSLLFKVDAAPAHGVLFRDINGNGLVNTGEQLGQGATFTQADLVAGRIKYAHDGSEGVTDGLKVSVSDGVYASAAETVSFNITPVNDAPTLTATAQNPAYTEGGSAAQLFASAAAAGIETGQRATGLKLTVENLRDGADEQLVINGRVVELSGATASGTLGDVDGVAAGFTVSFSGGTATVQLTAADGITEADLLALVNNLRYQNTSANPSEGKRDITLTELSDNGGTADGGLDKAALNLSSSVTVTAVNSAPTLSSPGITVLEGGSLTMTTTQFNAADADSPLSSLTYRLDTAPSAGTLFIDLDGDGVIDSGEALGSNGSFTHADLAAGRVRYQHDGSENGDSFDISVSDGSVSSAPVAVNVNRTPVNDAPVLSGLDGTTVSYPANSGAKAVDRNGVISVTDSDSASFDGGQLRVSIQSNNDAAKDVLSLSNIGTGAGEIGISGSNVTFGGTVIGTVSGGSGAHDLVITFNDQATAAVTEALIRAVQFSNSDANPALPLRSIGFTLLDGDGGVSQTASVNLALQTNTQPIILNGSGFYVAENTTAVTVMAATDPHGRPVTYSISGGADAGKFVINASTGALRFATGQDYEQPADVGADNVYNVKVRATNDEGSFSEAELAVNLVDVVDETAQDDAAPVFGFATVNGNRLVMSYTDQSALDAVHVPGASAFNVMSGGRANAVTAVVVDALAKTVTLTLASGVANGAAVTVAYTDPTAGNDSAALQDVSGNDVASMGATAVTNLTPGAGGGGGGVVTPVTPPVTTPGTAPGTITNVTTVVTTVDGGQSTVNTGMIGTVRVVETVYVHTNGTTEKSMTVTPSANGGATILPLLYEAGGTTASNTTVSLSEGVGMTSIGARTPMGTGGSLDLIELIKTSVSGADSLLSNMVSGGQQFLDGRPASSTLWVNKIVLDGTGAGAASVTVDGAANNSQSVTTGDKLEGLVIDASSLKPGSTLNLSNVDFAVVIGDNIKIRGGDGENVVYGGAGSQDIMLGADDDILFGGDGDDTIGSAGGNDMIYGNAGNDLLFGGAGLDVLHGGADNDVAVYEGNMGRYSIIRDHGKTIVRSLDRLDDIDTLVNVETIRFADHSYTVENSQDMSMVATAYARILDRQADLDGFQWWMAQVDSGSISSGDMGVFMLNSTEFKATNKVDFSSLSQSDQVHMLYETILDRDAEQEGFDYWMAQLDKGMSMADVVTQFMESAELIGQYSAKSDWEFSL